MVFENFEGNIENRTPNFRLLKKPFFVIFWPTFESVETPGRKKLQVWTSIVNSCFKTFIRNILVPQEPGSEYTSETSYLTHLSCYIENGRKTLVFAFVMMSSTTTWYLTKSFSSILNQITGRHLIEIWRDCVHIWSPESNCLLFYIYYQVTKC